MVTEWHVSQEVANRIKQFVDEGLDDVFVRVRICRNLADSKQSVGKAEFWKQLVSARLTTQQDSGPESLVAKFILKKPFPLDFDLVKKQKGDAEFIVNELSLHGLNRFPNEIPKDLSFNFHKLEQSGQWEETLGEINQLCTTHEKRLERKVANYVQVLLRGFGPKQSRNLLQALGLTLYEIPIDTRVVNRLTSLGYPDKLSTISLSNQNKYEDALDGIQALCETINVIPCVLDAALFASYDDGKWTKENVIF